MNNRGIWIAHYTDIDGVFSHVLAEMYKPEFYEHRHIDYGAEDIPFKDVPAGYENLVFADLGYNTNSAFERALGEIRRINDGQKRVGFFDHHNWPAELIEELFLNPVHDEKSSTTPLVAQTLLSGYDVAREFGQIAYNDDRQIFDERAILATDLVNAIRMPNSNYSMDDLIVHLAELDSVSKLESHLVPNKAIGQLNYYRDEVSSAKKSLENSLRTEQTLEGGQKVYFGLIPDILFMKPGNRHLLGLEEVGANPSFCLYEGRDNVLFNGQNQDNFNRITTQMRGGGRGFEGGFTLPQVTTEQNYASQIEYIKNKLKD